MWNEDIVKYSKIKKNLCIVEIKAYFFSFSSIREHFVKFQTFFIFFLNPRPPYSQAKYCDKTCGKCSINPSREGELCTSTETVFAGCDQKCIISANKPKCVCHPGYKNNSDPRKCDDINECSSKTSCDSKGKQFEWLPNNWEIKIFGIIVKFEAK